jgi:Holliday junction resolvase-like predicted endonuclease
VKKETFAAKKLTLRLCTVLYRNVSLRCGEEDNVAAEEFALRRGKLIYPQHKLYVAVKKLASRGRSLSCGKEVCVAVM